ncbi:MAG TPA: hypothetical protein VN932_01870 [Rhizomicrobium sp.]|nr:hypothetical protein [Rhizomicrobium sp.]
MIITTEGTGAQQHSRYQYRFKRLALSGIAVKNPLIDLVPDAIGEASQRDLDDEKLQGYQGKEAIHTPNLMVGLDVLRHLHLYIAYKEGKIYATAADAAPPATPASASPAAPAGH